MKKLISCGLLMVALGVSAAVERTGVAYRSRNVAVGEHAVTLARFGEPLTVPDIAIEGNWTVKNYQGLLQVAYGRPIDGEKCLVLTAPSEPADNAWQLNSPRLPLPTTEGGVFVLSLKRGSSKMCLLAAPWGGKREWVSAVWWFDAMGKPLGREPLRVESYPGKELAQLFLRGEIPSGAASFEISLGNDTPDLEPNASVWFSDVRFSVARAGGASYLPQGAFESEICCGGRVSWTADVPKGTVIAFQAAAADNPETVFNLPFSGPDGTAKSYYRAPFEVKGAYLRWKAFFFTSDRAVTPTLRSVTVGKVSESRWSTRRDSLMPRVQFLGETPTTNRHADVRLRIWDVETFYVPETFRAAIDGRDCTSEFVREGEVYRLSARSEPWAEGLHEIRVTAGDVRGNQGETKVYFFIGEAPKTPKVTLRDDGMTLIDGKPYFPLGMYSVRKHAVNGNDLDRAVRECKEAGFNMVHSYDRPRFDEFLAMAEKHGMKVFFEARVPNEKFVKRLRHSPSIIAWYLGDDTFQHEKPEELMSYQAAVKAVDPTRLTTQASGVWAEYQTPRYADFVEGTDNILPEIYSVLGPKGGKGHFTCVASVVRDMKAIGRCQRLHGAGRPRSSWAIIQNFRGWSKNWAEFPTHEELYGMTFAAICNGTQGLTWYSYEPGSRDRHFAEYGENQGATSTPERWADMKALVGKLSSILPVLTARAVAGIREPVVLSGPKLDPMGNNSISMIVKRVDGDLYVLTANSSFAAIRAKISAKGICGEGEVLWEDRRVRAEDGSFADDFSPYGYHVYRFRE